MTKKIKYFRNAALCLSCMGLVATPIITQHNIQNIPTNSLVQSAVGTFTNNTNSWGNYTKITPKNGPFENFSASDWWSTMLNIEYDGFPPTTLDYYEFTYKTESFWQDYFSFENVNIPSVNEISKTFLYVQATNIGDETEVGVIQFDMAVAYEMDSSMQFLPISNINLEFKRTILSDFVIDTTITTSSNAQSVFASTAYTSFTNGEYITNYENFKTYADINTLPINTSLRVYSSKIENEVGKLTMILVLDQWFTGGVLQKVNDTTGSKILELSWENFSTKTIISDITPITDEWWIWLVMLCFVVIITVILNVLFIFIGNRNRTFKIAKD